MANRILTRTYETYICIWWLKLSLVYNKKIGIKKDKNDNILVLDSIIQFMVLMRISNWVDMSFWVKIKCKNLIELVTSIIFKCYVIESTLFCLILWISFMVVSSRAWCHTYKQQTTFAIKIKICDLSPLYYVYIFTNTHVYTFEMCLFI